MDTLFKTPELFEVSTISNQSGPCIANHIQRLVSSLWLGSVGTKCSHTTKINQVATNFLMNSPTEKNTSDTRSSAP
jgi:hypothetical protein